MLTQTRPSLDPTAIERQVREPDFDYRTRLLVHDSNLKSEFTERLAECRNHFQDEKLMQSAKHNWYVLFGEDLPG